MTTLRIIAHRRLFPPCEHPSSKPGAKTQGVLLRTKYCRRPVGHAGNHRYRAGGMDVR